MAAFDLPRLPAPDRMPAPMAVVALGDPARRDDGIAIRVIGRVRTIVGEIGLARAQVSRPRRAGSLRSTAVRPEGRPPDRSRGLRLAYPETEARPPAEGVASQAEGTAGQLVEWIEGGTDARRLDPVLAERKRVVLVDAVRISGRVGDVHHWHLGIRGESGLSMVRRLGGQSRIGLDHLALWLEDELPIRGTDLIGIEPHDLGEGPGLSRPLRTRFSHICSQVTAILVRILEEEGW